MNPSSHRPTARWLTLAGFSAAAVAAQASEPASAANGVMTFPNVSVIAAPSTSRGATQAPGAQGGMRAFIDPVTGKLAPPTAEQAAELEAATPTRPSVASRVGASATTPAAVYPSRGGVGLTLDESQMSYFVARKDASGKVETTCIPGNQVAHWSAKKAPARHAAKAAAAGERK